MSVFINTLALGFCRMQKYLNEAQIVDSNLIYSRRHDDYQKSDKNLIKF